MLPLDSVTFTLFKYQADRLKYAVMSATHHSIKNARAAFHRGDRKGAGLFLDEIECDVEILTELDLGDEYLQALQSNDDEESGADAEVASAPSADTKQ